MTLTIEIKNHDGSPVEQPLTIPLKLSYTLAENVNPKAESLTALYTDLCEVLDEHIYPNQATCDRSHLI